MKVFIKLNTVPSHWTSFFQPHALFLVPLCNLACFVQSKSRQEDSSVKKMVMVYRGIHESSIMSSSFSLLPLQCHREPLQAGANVINKCRKVAGVLPY